MTDRAFTQGFSLEGKSACLVGCGGLGCNISVHLVGAGIERLVICDFDTVSESNLNRQFVYTKKDIAKPKTECMKRFLDSFGETKIEAHNINIKSQSDLEFAKSCDVVLLAVDNSDARQIVAEFCDNNDIPMVFGGIDGFYGMAYLYIPKVSPPPAIDGDGAKHNVSCTAGIIGSAQAALAIQYLITKDIDLSGNLLVYDRDTFDTLSINKKTNSP